MVRMRKSPLYPVHERLGARMVQADGWTMPHSFRNLFEEHLAARSACAVFDVSHICKFRVRGNGAEAWLETALSGRVAGCRDAAGVHTLLMSDDGRILDRLLLLRESAGNFLLLGHAAMEEVDAARLEELRPHAALELRNETNEWCAVVLMGPESELVLARTLRGVELPERGRFSRFFFQNHELMLGRLGLEEEGESERAYEFFCPAVAGISWFESFIEAGAQPCGSATRESLRLARGCVAVGKEITPRRSTPGQVGLGHLCCPDKLRAGDPPPRKKVAHLLCPCGSRVAPDPGDAVRDTAGHTIGRVTSAAFSPEHDAVVALALVAAEFAQPGVQLVLLDGGQEVPVQTI